jgi:hypothetical protein
MTLKPSGSPNPLVALVLGFVLPGAGHYYGGQKGKAVLFCVLITGTIVAGFFLGNKMNVLSAQLWFLAQCAGGGPALALWPLSERYAGGIAREHVDWADRHHEVGTLFTAVAGFLNLLVMMDAYVSLAYPRRREEEDAPDPPSPGDKPSAAGQETA